ncbi:MAG: hypothetical protein ABIA59_11255 [Candidatus Latescibacterota bacterium]
MKKIPRTLQTVFLVMILSLFVISSCEQSTAPKRRAPSQSLVIDYERENQEAEEAALWLSGELEAPEELYLTIRDDLAQIRSAYHSGIPEVAITFFPPWVPGMLLLGVTDDAKRQIRLGIYHDLDSLNTLYHLADMDTSRLGRSSSNSISLIFKGRLHPGVLSAQYGLIPSLIYAEPNGWIGDWSNVYPWITDEGMTYLFRKGEGDCPAGCIDSYFWYFKITDAGIDYIGSWESGAPPEPHWWMEAKQAYEHYRYGW